MKAYLFIETGEVRPVKIGEWCNVLGSIHFQNITGSIDKYPILTRHEIEIPEWATHINLDVVRTQDVIHAFRRFPILRPKKVKKCQYITINSDRFGHKRGEVTGWLTEREAKKRGLEPEDRIYQTEIEVEE